MSAATSSTSTAHPAPGHTLAPSRPVAVSVHAAGVETPRGGRRKLISVCTPAYNEEANVERCYQAVCAFFDGPGAPGAAYDFELVFTDNHSTDATFEKVAAIARTDPRVRILRFSRNFGYQRSIQTGYRHARGDAAVQLDADLEDPPAVIAQFLEKWEQGYQVVYGVRRSRQEGPIIQLARKVFYRLLNRIAEDDLPADVGDFRLIDRRVIDQVAKIRDPHLYIRGRIAAMGFNQIGVPYDRDRRIAGASKFNFTRLMALALDATLSHSTVPLRLATYTGLVISLVAVVLIVGYSLARVLFGTSWPAGFTTLAVLTLMGIGINGLFLGIIGEYLARIYRHLKDSAEVIVERAYPEETGTSQPPPRP